MSISDLISKSLKPVVYEMGTAFMWTDKHISKQLLDIHLHPDMDLASRKKSTIVKTANWILDIHKEKGKLNILDLGCGPGLYTEIFAQNNHSVTGIDISTTSIDYAKKSAQENGLDITYLKDDYLSMDLEANTFDLVVLIYTDFGVLLPNDRKRLLDQVFRVLKKGGMFIFDVLKDNEIESKITPKSWDAAESGFWRNSPYMALSESFLYKEQNVILYQHIIADSDEHIETYRFWTHFFSQEKLNHLLESHRFTDIQFRDDVLPAGDQWNGDDVLFCIASK